ncbi:hypothetical protein ACD591_16830 [Rufibacter glacialis]|uniref:MotA/TolQ/ExbB proton channel domain-containing protein n=1 Tax=Rufibacter glacialis TaxID=1259555 RepID=A0A5M8QGH9_9BACT|nr:hypothetical protein [Rufibacter glacialis]KAA6434251.1 hypothetical protein FOE74_08565 [Rufibacter glacialis]GGK68083.1 hypothetical protein GCM10011405_15100 [Rufibacter glacialis]
MEGIFIFEAILVLLILGYQWRVYQANLAKINQITGLFPGAENLSVARRTGKENPLAAAAPGLSLEQQWEKLLYGEYFREFSPTNPVLKRIIAVDAEELHIEVQNGETPFYTIAIDKFRQLLNNGNLYLASAAPAVSPPDSAEQGETFDLIEVREPSATFQKIIQSTNDYLRVNKGAAADFNILKDVAERYAEAQDNEVQSTVATPLYVGLLGTFSGVIIGLSSLVYTGLGGSAEDGSSFITDQNIPSFLFGVLIAMAGSLCGLLLTMMGNNALKNARSTRDRLKNDYYTFLQTHLLPKLNSDMAASLGNLKSVLDSFNRDFLDKIMGFRPIVESLTDNISTQKEFIQKLDEIGFTQMANANLQVFDKIKESERLFLNFLQYQEALNESVRKGGELTTNITQVLNRLTKLQEGFDQVPGYLQQHDESIQRQINFFARHEEELDTIANRTEQYFDKAALKLTDLMQARLQHQERDAQNAYEKWQEHFRRLNEDNLYQRILDYMQPFQNLTGQQDTLNRQQQDLAQEIKQTNERLLQKIDTDSEIQQRLLQQLAVLNANVEKSMEPGPLKAAMGKIFGSGQNHRRKL